MNETVNTETTEEEDDWDDLLSEFEPEVEQEERKLDGDIAKLAKNQRRLAERQAKMEAQSEREKLVSDFYAKASDDEKQFADVFLAGVSEPEKVKKMLDLAHAKATALNPESTEEVAEVENEEENSEVERALSAPLESSNIQPKDPRKEYAVRTAKGDMHATFVEFMDLPATREMPKTNKD